MHPCGAFSILAKTDKILNLTRVQIYKEAIILPVDAVTAYVYLIRAFRNAGTIQIEKPELRTVFGKITGGLVQRADLTGQIEAIDESSCRLVVKSVAQEDMTSTGAGAVALTWLLNEIRAPITQMAGSTFVKCKKCGDQNPSGYRYCGTCGTPLYIPGNR